MQSIGNKLSYDDAKRKRYGNDPERSYDLNLCCDGLFYLVGVIKEYLLSSSH